MFPNIEAERARRGLTLDEFTAAIGVCRKTYYNWNALGKIPENKVEAIARLFGVPTDYIEIYEEEQK